MTLPAEKLGGAILTTTSKLDLQEIIGDWKAQNLKIGLVPTMGALHEGHLSLIKIALENSDRVVVTIFVNPTQFAPHEDFDIYPRKEAQDIAKLEESGAHLVYIPAASEIYPDGPASTLKAGPAAQGLESDFRPHFFDGVATVVHRLFEHAQPDIAVFGEKDFQQLQVIKEMVKTQDMPVKIISAPIMRDEHGLALASRNVYLSEEGLQIARQLNKVLSEATETGNIEAAKTKVLETGFDKIDYIEKRWNRILAAAWIGKTRLIDNMEI
ncbi:MAG: pantothenate synthetase [Micavibrio sp.]|nr:MAG: pantothenate synthetase [Micavibrio sp.]